MKPQNLNALLILCVSFSFHAHAQTTLPLNTSQLTDDLGAVKPGVNCWPLNPLRPSRLASIRDCLQVILLLPESADSGVFHTGNPSDVLQLPVAKTHGTCQVLVTMTGMNFDKSSWDHIAWVAGQMIAICGTGQYPYGQTGGVTYVGTRNQIRLSLEKAGLSDTDDGDGANSTATS